MRRRRVKVILWVTVAVVLLPGVYLTLERVRGKISLARYKRRLMAEGYTVRPELFVGRPAREENGAPTILERFKELREGVILPKSLPPRMKLTRAGRAVVCFRENEWEDDTVTNHWDQMAADLMPNEETLGKIREALKQPVLLNVLNFSQGYKMPVTHLAPVKALSIWFGARIQLNLHQGQTHAALEDLLAEARLPQLMAKDRIAISGMFSIAIAAIARADVWEALQSEGWQDQELAALQSAWESQTFATNMVEALEGEIRYADASYDLMRKSNYETISLIYGMEEIFGSVEPERPLWKKVLRQLAGGDPAADFLRKNLYCRIWRFAWLDQEELRYLQQLRKLLEFAHNATAEKSLAAVHSDKALYAERCIEQGAYDRLRYPTMKGGNLTLSGFVDKAMRAETERSMVISAIALKRYFLQQKAWPTSLNELMPKLLSSVPVDYMDGHPLKYRLNPDSKYTLYSVGLNFIDDRGDSSLSEETRSSRNLWDRKDFIWPLEAQPEEVEAYRNHVLPN